MRWTLRLDMRELWGSRREEVWVVGVVRWGGGGGLLMKASPAEAFMFTKMD